RACRNCPVRPGIFVGQLGAQSLPEDADDQIAIRRPRDLRLEVVLGPIVFLLPADQLQLRAVDTLGVELPDDVLGAIALDLNIRGRRKNSTVVLHRHPPRRCPPPRRGVSPAMPYCSEHGYQTAARSTTSVAPALSAADRPSLLRAML